MSDRESLSSASPSATNPEVDTSDTHNYPSTPLNDHLNAQAPGELSPPRSGDTQAPHQIAQHLGDESVDMLDEDLEGHEGDAFSQSGLKDARDVANGDTASNYVPGSGWNNKKSQDEFHRALENVIDQDFSLAEFGDPLLDEPLSSGTTAQSSRA